MVTASGMQTPPTIALLSDAIQRIIVSSFEGFDVALVSSAFHISFVPSTLLTIANKPRLTIKDSNLTFNSDTILV